MAISLSLSNIAFSEQNKTRFGAVEEASWRKMKLKNEMNGIVKGKNPEKILQGVPMAIGQPLRMLLILPFLTCLYFDYMIQNGAIVLLRTWKVF